MAIKYNPESAWYYGNRAKAHIRLQNLEEAQQDAISAIILCPTDDEASLLTCGHEYHQHEGHTKFKMYSTTHK